MGQDIGSLLDILARQGFKIVRDKCYTKTIPRRTSTVEGVKADLGVSTKEAINFSLDWGWLGRGL